MQIKNAHIVLTKISQQLNNPLLNLFSINKNQNLVNLEYETLDSLLNDKQEFNKNYAYYYANTNNAIGKLIIAFPVVGLFVSSLKYSE